MRVTKLIREYVEKKVREKFPESAEELAYEEHSKNINEAIEKANEKVFEYAKKLAEEVNEKYGFPADSNLVACDRNRLVGRRYNYDSEIYRTYRKTSDERQKKITEKIEEILLTLELGGTKADLDEMLANIGK